MASNLTAYERKLKIMGAVEALASLLDHCRVHTIPVDEDVVFKYLEKTKGEATQLESAVPGYGSATDLRAQLSSIASAVYPHKTEPFTYAVPFMVEEIKKRQTENARLKAALHKWDNTILREIKAENEALRHALKKQRMDWQGICEIELDGPRVDFAENRIREIDATLSTPASEHKEQAQ